MYTSDDGSFYSQTVSHTMNTRDTEFYILPIVFWKNLLGNKINAYELLCRAI